MVELKDLFEKGKWYHCFRHENLISNGTYDVEQHLHQYKFEKQYKGQTVLDVGCSDGYFSLWMKEHGADHVCAIDSNKYDGSVAISTSDFDRKVYEQKYSQYAADFDEFRPLYEQFGLKSSNKLLLMAALKGLEIKYHTGTIYNLKPYGTFDVVLCNDLLEHLRDPITAIEQLYLATNTKGKCIITTVSPSTKERLLGRRKPILTYQGHIASGGYYIFSEASVIAMCKAAGFGKVEIVSRFEMLNRAHDSGIKLFTAHAYK